MKVVSSREVYSSPIFRVTEDKAVGGGFEIRRAVVKHPGSAVMMALDESSRILLVRQYRLPAQRYLWELPAGRLDQGETPLRAARRELKEETGYRARTWRRLASFYPSPGFLSEKITAYLATGLTTGEATPMDDERIECRWFSRGELEEGIAQGKIQDAKTIIAYFTWIRAKRRKAG